MPVLLKKSRHSEAINWIGAAASTGLLVGAGLDGDQLLHDIGTVNCGSGQHKVHRVDHTGDLALDGHVMRRGRSDDRAGQGNENIRGLEMPGYGPPYVDRTERCDLAIDHQVLRENALLCTRLCRFWQA